MAVSSQRLVSMAIGEKIEGEDLGGWRLHADVTGFADQVADTDEEALDAIKTFLGYMPGHHNELPPERPVPPGSDDAAKTVAALVPEKRTQVYDLRKVIHAVVDKDSSFEMKPRFGKTEVTSLARSGGRPAGFVAHNPLSQAGATDAHARS